MQLRYTLFLMLIASFFLNNAIEGQATIEWQRSLGTTRDDHALKLFTDPEGNLVVAGEESHQDLTGEFRTYLMITKMGQDGQEIWKKYHDVAFQTFSPPGNYSIGKHFYSNEFGQRLINFLVDLGNRFVIFKINDDTGAYFSFEEVPSQFFTVNQRNEKTFADVSCSWQVSCYGPDSLTLTKFNEIPDSVFNFVDWTYEWKQDLRTASIEGHYDIDLNDIALDKDGNTYLLAQIERWDFRFCTDCSDAFIDAHNMIFKFDTLGALVGRERLNITHAVVSNMQFVAMEDDHMVIRIDDINSQGTQLQNDIFYVNPNLDITTQFSLDRYYTRITTDASGQIYAMANAYNAVIDPEIHGESDLLVAKFDEEGNFQWKAYYGGSSFDFPVGITATSDDGIVLIANSSSDDFDVENHIGSTDMWLLKLREGSTALDDEASHTFTLFPNPVLNHLYFSPADIIQEATIYDVSGRRILTAVQVNATQGIDVSSLASGIFFLEIESQSGREIYKITKQ